MHSLWLTLGVLICVVASAWFGMGVRSRLPDHHLNADSKDAVKVGMALVATMSALVLGLLIASAKSAYDTQSAEIRQLAANVAMLDKLLAAYGAETQATRVVMRESVRRVVGEIWQRGSSRATALEDPVNDLVALVVFRAVHALTPQDEVHRGFKEEMIEITRAIAKTRWELITEEGSAIPMPFLAVLVFWLMVLFASFGLFAPNNATVIVAFMVCALSVSGAIFLILELDRPFEGLMRVSDAPLVKVLGH